MAWMFGDLSAITLGPGAVGAVLGQSLLSTALAYLIYFRVLATACATNRLLVTFLMPPIALVLGVGGLGEQPSPQSLAGMAVIFLGLVLIDGRPFRWSRRGPGKVPAHIPRRERVGHAGAFRRRGRRRNIR